MSRSPHHPITPSPSHPIILLLALSATPAPAQAPHPIPEAERWATITHPGNAPWQPGPGSNYPFPIGRVDYEYQISRTEVTGGEWWEFVQAYAPYVDPSSAWASAFTSWYVTPYSLPGGGVGYTFSEFGRNRPVWIAWRFAARYVNWLHNNKRPERWAFESGVYDTSTFGGDATAGFTDQIAHHPNARYWIPTIHEWVKATYWDPNRYGPGQPGYWLYSYSQDTPPVPGRPWEQGAQTSAGISWSGFPVPEVAAYRNARSPWGLWDTSGGRTEMLDTAYVLNGRLKGRFVRGTEYREYGSFTSYFEHIDYSSTITPTTGISGLRIARRLILATKREAGPDSEQIKVIVEE